MTPTFYSSNPATLKQKTFCNSGSDRVQYGREIGNTGQYQQNGELATIVARYDLTIDAKSTGYCSDIVGWPHVMIASTTTSLKTSRTISVISTHQSVCKNDPMTCQYWLLKQFDMQDAGLISTQARY
ncbi:hypothetical protein [Undibacterium rugosum]|uniref:Uncharacterized protein n=1 Tax=Undibacterium rugosum TaxID=2762291 RepID=A0A923I638_9BURK|nr:hypothetical protein [Undibacterium rugosum]MBC3937227.1 hypothetical protein [Undibacterium rugosum]MBR7779292.1 hypothetical protein [Undibacterium rugosum]